MRLTVIMNPRLGGAWVLALAATFACGCAARRPAPPAKAAHRAGVPPSGAALRIAHAGSRPAPQVSALAVYRYDRGAPLEVNQEQLWRRDGVVQYHLWYTSANDQRVPALLTIPGSGRKPAVIMIQHFWGGSKDAAYIAILTSALAGRGYATIAIDAQYHGERRRSDRSQKLFDVRSPEMRDAFVQTVLDLRRALDLLQRRRDVDHGRVGYLGVSMGAILGTVFSAVDERVDAVCLLVGGGDLRRLVEASPSREVADNVRIMDPVNYAAMISPRPLLMINALGDEAVPRDCAQRLFDAARRPKRIEWYDGGHTDLGRPEIGRWITEFFDAALK
jgi:dienelactone hydrolase